MTTFDDRERGEETKFKHDLELGFKIRNRRNKLFGLWIAQTYLGLSGDEAVAYAKDVVMADFELPGDEDMISQGAGGPGARPARRSATTSSSSTCKEFEAAARKQVMAE